MKFRSVKKTPQAGILCKQMQHTSLDAAYFERLYSASDDPWSLGSSAYELGKYADTVATLGGPYQNCLEIGCSIGMLTAMLTQCCEYLTAIDVSSRALELAQARCARLKNIFFHRMFFPQACPSGSFDAVVLSETAYYWSDPDLALAKERISALGSGGVLELIHYLPKVDEHIRDGDSVHAEFIADPRFSLIQGHRAQRYRIDLLRIL